MNAPHTFMHSHNVSGTILAIALILSGSATPASGFVAVMEQEGKVLHWELLQPMPSVHTNVVNPKTKAVRYFLAAEAFSTTNRQNELNALRSCFAQWQSVPGTHLKFEEGGLLPPGPGVDINTTDNTNLVFWVKNGSLINGGRDDMRGALGLTYQDFLGDSILVEADIVLNGNSTVNGARNSWFTDVRATSSSDRFVEAVALHEIGHFIGLNHSPAGASSMMVRGTPGVGTQPGLSTDDKAAAAWIYPAPNAPSAVISGVVSMAGKPILGACVVAENSVGSLIQATVTRENGRYAIPSLAPGVYKIRVCPLDPRGAKSSLISGPDIDPFGAFLEAETGFFPSAETAVTVPAAGTITQNFDVVPAESAAILRITRIRPPNDVTSTFFSVNTAAPIHLGRRQTYVGVYGPNLPVSGASLSVTGDGITHGPVTFIPEAFTGLNLVTVRIDVAEDATPGIRSFVLRMGDKVAYANGFLEVLPRYPDWNFDGVDDLFQRQYFNPFTAPEAGPEWDWDQDGFNNLQESLAGTNPLDAQSVFRIESAALSTQGFSIRWQGAAGHRYRILSRSAPEISGWLVAAEVVGAQNGLNEFVDRRQESDRQFYRVVGIP